MKKDLRIFLTLLGIFILFLLIQRVGPGNILDSFTQIEKRLLLLAFVPFLIYFLLVAYKWKYLLDRKEMKFAFRDVFIATLVGYFFAFFTPSQLGSLAKIVYLKNSQVKYEELAATAFLDKLLEFFTLFFLGIISIFFFLSFLDYYFFWLLVAVFSFLTFSLYLIFHKKRGKKILKPFYALFVPSFVKRKLEENLRLFYNSLPSLRDSLIPAILAFLGWIVVYTSIFIIGLSLGINIPLHLMIFALSLSTAVGLIPVTVSGLGTREASLIFILGRFSISPDKVLVMSLLGFLIAKLLPALVGGILTFRWKT